MSMRWADLPPDVRAWMAGLGEQDFQLSPAWVDNFIAHVDVGPAEPLVAVWRENGLPVAAMALLLEGGTLRSLGNYYTTRHALWLAPGATHDQAQAWLTALLRLVMAAHPGVHSLKLSPMRADAPCTAALRAALRNCGCAVFDWPAFDNWSLPIRTDWPTYRASLDGALRTTLSRMGKRFAARGGRLEIVTADTLAESSSGTSLEAAIAAYTAVYTASWRLPEPHPGFVPGLIRAAAAAGSLRLGLAWVGHQPVAAQLWLVTQGRADIYKLAHDEAHRDLSPGSLLSEVLMHHAFEVDRVQLVDYLSGNDAYKRLWMTDEAVYIGLHGLRLNRPMGLLAAAFVRLFHALRR